MATTKLARGRGASRTTVATTTYLFRIDLTSEADGRWTVDVPELPGCVTWGKTREEALEHAQEAVELYLETLHDLGRPIPRGVRTAARPVVAVTV